MASTEVDDSAESDQSEENSNPHDERMVGAEERAKPVHRAEQNGKLFPRSRSSFLQIGQRTAFIEATIAQWNEHLATFTSILSTRFG